MTSILITGGAGFIGSAFVRRSVAAEECRVVVLDKLTYAGNLDSLASVAQHDRFQFVQGDIGDAELVQRLLAEHRPQAIVNLAAESHVDRSIDHPDAFVQTNVVGAWTLLEAALGYWRQLAEPARSAFRFLQVSTDEVYGSLGPQGTFTESSPYAPNSPYSASKAAADHFVQAYHQTYGLPTLVTNCSNNYGPYQFPEKLIPLMTLNAINGRPLPVYGDGQHVRDWLFVEDQCDALQAVLSRGAPGQSYNLGGQCERTNLEVVQTICATIDRLLPELPQRPTQSLIQFVADRPGHDRRYALDTTKIERELGWQAKRDFSEGLELTIGWYLENTDWVERVTSGKYRGERLGLDRQQS